MSDVHRLNEQERRYRETMGEDALRRQQQRAIERFNCCGGLRKVGHKRGCKHYTGRVVR